jgi:hypothetical protein
VNLTVPSSAGGATIRYRGKQARSFCRRELTGDDQLALRAWPARPDWISHGLAHLRSEIFITKVFSSREGAQARVS